MLNDIQEVYFSKEELEAIVSRLATRISEDYKDKNLLMISVLKGSVCFMADLMRALTIPCRIDFLTASSYGAATKSVGEVKINKFFNFDLSEYDMLVVEDIFDSGKTLQSLTDFFKKEENPKSIKICTLLDKPDRRDPNVEIKATYVGATVPDEFVVGYGLDFDERYRNLPFIGILKPEIYSDN